MRRKLRASSAANTAMAGRWSNLFPRSRSHAARGNAGFANFIALFVLACLALTPAFADPLAGTQPLTMKGDLSAQMVAGIGRYLDRETEKARAVRLEIWRTRDP